MNTAAITSMDDLRTTLRNRRVEVGVELQRYQELVTLRETLDRLLEVIDGPREGDGTDRTERTDGTEESAAAGGDVRDDVWCDAVNRYGLGEHDTDAIRAGGTLPGRLREIRNVIIVAMLAAMGDARGSRSRAAEFLAVSLPTINDAIARVGANPAQQGVAEDIVTAVSAAREVAR